MGEIAHIDMQLAELKQVEYIGKETLRQRTDQYLSWVNAYAVNHEIRAKHCVQAQRTPS